MQNYTIPCYTVTLCDESTLTKQRSKLHPGKGPTVSLLALKVNNKKVTQISGLELFMIDLNEFQTYLRNKCQASVTKDVHVGGLKVGNKETATIVVQGN